ncbi:MAG TPA: hypothetical protein PLD20_12855 [Blastocatellia bacterium]|nr:hypothetical protein [Blastocatellia bacterium]HMV86867.1 hypothetical protein [Blastocatellia bacterium]HMY72543.1 hypothetical protein [Blastocatellia bacterium]HMZ18817.1 hypothetical protein [Blastocatellia bacterium]HNG29859.1 hypothetical protein [Blastocatellia bacterium]
MSKTKSNRKGKAVQNAGQTAPDAGKRKFLLLGLGGAGALAVAGIGYGAGWFGSSAPTPAGPVIAPTPKLATGKPLPPVTLTANYQNALAAANDLTSFYARELNNASTLIHAVRAFGKNFKLNDGSLAVDFLCSRFAAEKEINGKRYVYFTRDAEVHEFSFLKTMLEAGVSPDQPVTVGGNKYTLRDVGESAKMLFRCDQKNFDRYEANYLGRHMPWALISFSILVPPAQSTWTNAYGETINLPEIIDTSLAVLNGLCEDVQTTSARGELESLEFRKGLKKFSCDGMHSVYGYYSCLKHGYTQNNMQERMNKLTDNVLLRLREDSLAIDREADAVKSMGPDFITRLAQEDQGGKVTTKGAPPAALAEVMRFRFQIRMLGHAMEALNYAKLHKLIKLTPAQEGKLRAGEQLLYDYLVKLRATDLQPYMNWHDKFVSETVIALAHAARGMKLLTSDNPDTVA